MGKTLSNAFRLNVIQAGGWTPPYSVPAQGQVTAIGTNNWQSLRPSGWGANQWEYPYTSAYTGGCWAPGLSTAGVYLAGPGGGHDSPDTTSMIAFDFTTGAHTLIEHQNPGAIRYGPSGSGFQMSFSDMTNDSYQELLSGGSASGVPAPGHWYQHHVYVPGSVAGNTKGILVTGPRIAIVTSGSGVTSCWAVNKFNFDTNLYSRASSTTWENTLASEGGCVYDPGRQRIWRVQQIMNGRNDVEYFQLPGFTRGVANIGGAGAMPNDYTRCHMHGTLLMATTVAGDLWLFDPDAPTLNWRRATTSSTLPTEPNAWAWHPGRGKWYYLTSGGGSTLYSLTPPANPFTGTWQLATQTMPVSVPTKARGNETAGGGFHSHYNRLIHVPALGCLAWLPGGTAQVYLINPAS